jgi:hypothetical protein
MQGNRKEYPMNQEASQEVIERPLTITREEMDKVLESENFVPENLIGLLERDFGDLFAKDAKVKAGYSIKQHTLMALGQFEKYFSKRDMPEGIGRNLFRLVIALHDIGKPIAIEKGSKHFQHEYTHRLAIPALKSLGFSQNEQKLAFAMLAGDPLGDFIRRGDLFSAAEEIRALARSAGFPPRCLLDILAVFYCVDAGSYTLDAGGIKGLDNLFVFEKGIGRMSFSQKTAAKVEMLKKVLSEDVSEAMDPGSKKMF